MVGKYGLGGLLVKTGSAEMVAAVNALVGACQAFDMLDDYPGQIDQTLPTGIEDEPPAEG
jgi:hypothetical protein